MIFTEISKLVFPPCEEIMSQNYYSYVTAIVCGNPLTNNPENPRELFFFFFKNGSEKVIGQQTTHCVFFKHFKTLLKCEELLVFANQPAYIFLIVPD